MMNSGGGAVAPGPQGPQGKRQGVVKIWFGEKGFGFVVPDGGGEDVFVHRRALAGVYELAEGDKVLFETEFEKSKGKLKALYCEVIGGQPGGGGGSGAPGGKKGGKGGRGKGGGQQGQQSMDGMDMGNMGMMGKGGGGGFGGFDGGMDMG